MKIVYPYQTRRLGGVFCDDKAEIQPLYDEALQVRAVIQAQISMYEKALEPWILDKFKNIESWAQPQYSKFRAAVERCYGNWKKPATDSKVAYEDFAEELSRYIARADVQAKIASIYGAPGAGGSGGGTSFMLPESGGSAALIPGTSAALNPWIMAGAVGIALFIGYRLMRKV